MNVIFILFGGVVADRLRGTLVLVVSCSLAALSQAAVAGLVLTGTATIPRLLAFARSPARSRSAAAALVPQTVPGDLLRQANALNRSAPGMSAAPGGGWWLVFGLAADA